MGHDYILCRSYQLTLHYHHSISIECHIMSAVVEPCLGQSICYSMLARCIIWNIPSRNTSCWQCWAQHPWHILHQQEVQILFLLECILCSTHLAPVIYIWSKSCSQQLTYEQYELKRHDKPRPPRWVGYT